MKAVFVEWLDSATQPGWDIANAETRRPLTIRSVGLLVEKTKDVVILTTSRSQSGKSLDQLTIPRSVIVKFKNMRIPR